jgi:hypothetical protein
VLYVKKTVFGQEETVDLVMGPYVGVPTKRLFLANLLKMRQKKIYIDVIKLKI